MMKFSTVIAAAACAAALLLQPGLASAATTPVAPASFEQPSQMIHSVADALLKEIDGHRAELRAHPQRISAIVEKYLLPHFDAALAADLVLGRFGRHVSAQQKQRFITAMRKALVRSYGTALLDFHSHMLTVYPTHLRPGTTSATVRTVLTETNGTRLPIDFYVLMTPNGWKVFDLVVEGVSYDMSYRAELAPQLQQDGLDAVIERLEGGEKLNAPKPHPHPQQR
ncbi:MAG: MlaC/ttg2D family ABC transporter substrate-binding protein [Steroidobacteraceae bacterium]